VKHLVLYSLLAALALVPACSDGGSSGFDAGTGTGADSDTDSDDDTDTVTETEDFCDLSDLEFPEGFEVYESDNISTITGIWGDAPDSVFAVTEGGTVLEFDGVSWTTEFSTFSGAFYEIWGYSPDDIYVTGREVFHFDGESWNMLAVEENPGWERNLVSIWGLVPGEVIVGGYDFLFVDPDDKAPSSEYQILLLTCGDTTCVEFSPQPSTGPYPTIYDVWGSSADDIYIAGEYGLWRFDGTLWSVVADVDYNFFCEAVSGTASNDVHAFCHDSAWHFDGQDWTPFYLNPEPFLPQLWVDDWDRAYVAGGLVLDIDDVDGIVASWDGTDWSTVSDELPRNPTAAFGVPGSGLWLGGECGLLVHYAFD
jgi:hypothetical protein